MDQKPENQLAQTGNRQSTSTMHPNRFLRKQKEK